MWALHRLCKYGKGLNLWIVACGVTILFYSTFHGSLGLRKASRSASVFVVRMDLFGQWLFRWMADMLLPGASEKAEGHIWSRAAQHGSQYVGAKPAGAVLKTNCFIPRVCCCWSLCAKITPNLGH